MRVGGAKLTIDSSSKGFTALRDRPYYRPVNDYPPGYSGYAAATMAQTQDAVSWAYENDIQIMTHGQFLREDQVDSYRDFGVFLSLFAMPTFYWGDWHRDHTVGPVNGENILPTGWVRQRGMMFGSHHDAPVAFPNSMRMLDATVTRRTRLGDVLGPVQRVDVMTALRAMTIWPAWQHFEEGSKGSIEVGKTADFAILSEDPTAIVPELLDTIQVLATIKEDTLIFEADENVREGKLRTSPFANNPVAAHQFLHAVYQGTGVEAP